jgi:RecB family endonuclease NucS
MPVKVIVNLPKQAVETLQQLAKKRETTVTEILRHAVSLEQQLDNELDQDARILILKKDGDLRELIVRTTAR